MAWPKTRWRWPGGHPRVFIFVFLCFFLYISTNVCACLKMSGVFNYACVCMHVCCMISKHMITVLVESDDDNLLLKAHLKTSRKKTLHLFFPSTLSSNTSPHFPFSLSLSLFIHPSLLLLLSISVSLTRGSLSACSVTVYVLSSLYLLSLCRNAEAAAALWLN